ncbi:nucleoside triphosphate pyrophosphatase [Neisseria leonii]|uniref:Maf family protein n=1 Tax=Neisseria leonii TaxID=2995413 RepID=UPI00237BA5D8|nr:nucleoside triphosphate pyrophosphatase [Neisseria sp. 3986]MDD9326150.1 Maf family nucleotide pyrophosphatase [Neisseria sp. 3986]
MNKPLPLILGSGSVFRKQQLARLGLDFQTASPDCDETPLPGESAADTAHRLSVAKARSLAPHYPAHLIIGADQVALCNGRQLGKPMHTGAAADMLAALSGQTIEFYSALALLNTQSGRLHTHTDRTTVKMRPLTGSRIAAYLTREPDAVYCAGAAKSEGLGGALIERIDSSDPNALIGLPLFRLIDFLAAEGVEILTA